MHLNFLDDVKFGLSGSNGDKVLNYDPNFLDLPETWMNDPNFSEIHKSSTIKQRQEYLQHKDKEDQNESRGFSTPILSEKSFEDDSKNIVRNF